MTGEDRPTEAMEDSAEAGSVSSPGASHPAPSQGPTAEAFPAGAEATTTAFTGEAMPSLTTASDLMTPAGTAQLVGSLLVVLGLIVVLGWLSRRLHRLAPGTRQRALRLVDALPVGARERIVLVEVGGQQLLVGLAPGRVQTLHVLDTPIVPTADAATPDTPASAAPATVAPGPAAPGTAAPGAFSAVLSRIAL